MNDPIRDVVQWAQARYNQPWQIDALRRVLEQSTVDFKDCAELAAMVRTSAGLQEPTHPGPRRDVTAAPAVESKDVPPPASAGASRTVILRRMHNLKFVNALAPGQELTFAERGLTLIYGENGTGKSGYARVLRRACRPWREKDLQARPLLSSVLESASPGTPEAEFEVGVGGHIRTVKWCQGSVAPSELSNFAVFDSCCVQPLIGDENTVAYRPTALSILPRLAKVLGFVAADIQPDIAKLREKPTTLPSVAPDSPVGVYLSRLGNGATLAEMQSVVGDVSALDAEENRPAVVVFLGNYFALPRVPSSTSSNCRHGRDYARRYPIMMHSAPRQCQPKPHGRRAATQAASSSRRDRTSRGWLGHG